LLGCAGVRPGLRQAGRTSARDRRGRGRYGSPRALERGRAQPDPERLLPELRARVRGRRRVDRGGAAAGEGADMTLTAMWLMPLIGGALVAFLPPRLAKWFGVLVALVALFIAAFVAFSFAPGYHGYQFTERVPWIPQLSIFYRLGVDGISLWLVV